MMHYSSYYMIIVIFIMLTIVMYSNVYILHYLYSNELHLFFNIYIVYEYIRYNYISIIILSCSN